MLVPQQLRIFALRIVFLSSLLLPTCNAVLAAPALDQELHVGSGIGVTFENHESGDNLWAGRKLRQRFTTGRSGLVSNLAVQIFRLDDSLDDSGNVSIALASRALPPTSYHSVQIPISQIPIIDSFADPVPWTTIEVTPGRQMIEKGDVRSIIVTDFRDLTLNNTTKVYWRATGEYGSNDRYSGGELSRGLKLISVPNLSFEDWFDFLDGDGGFQTYVEPYAARRTASFASTFDLQAELSPTGEYSLIDGGVTITNDATAPADEQRGLMEFDLSGLPEDALITSAYLDLDFSDFTPGAKPTFSSVQVYGHAGDGSPNTSNVEDETILLDIFTVHSLGERPVGLDVSRLEDLLSQSDQIGFVTTGLTTQYPSSYFTSEQAALDENVASPTLRLEYISVLEGLIPGDFTADDVVDGTDFLSWQRELTDQQSLTDWEENFGMSNVLPLAVTVPEPSCGVLALGLLGTTCFARKSNF